MGVGSVNRLIALADDVTNLIDARNVKVNDRLMTDMSMSRVFFVDKSKKDKLLIRFTINNFDDSDPVSVITVTANHLMLRVVSVGSPDTETTSSSDDTRIPIMLPCLTVKAKDMRVGDHIPRWAGRFGVIVKREVAVGKSVQIMTENNILMIDRNIISCHVSPYNFSFYASRPVKFLSGISPYLVGKPFYILPKMIYKRMEI